MNKTLPVMSRIAEKIWLIAFCICLISGGALVAMAKDYEVDLENARRLNAEDLKAINTQIDSCVALYRTATLDQKQSVKVLAFYDHDKTLVHIYSENIDQSDIDAASREAAEIAKAALHDPACNPLTSLPDYKYELWHMLHLNIQMADKN